ncbi:uncharacterized protein CcaverHIS019_0301000 [Cutaneotrichosporon cavernicola]|uniref:DUF567-domain-containing protein n=1 Tax=Cutaneotrichosporon cavernicola TaxID=279322 RepID=A0AA48IAF1_9TREE|nr:uncharacterized protein CcaverHIS019_0301000 [Cutaneotrichosporon cavernicola]BEI90030.1 hypothetical protein CcaverHIS019_0301000 [Cutaneotrichosporon cavernicola]BEI97804.1 hypothetical protein CcaverHIS631_0301030 [Cutaneotrichosporon cavernicola]
MGLMTMFHASGSKELVPVIPPVAVYDEFVAQVPTTLCLKEKAWSMSGDDFGITDANTRKTVLKCKGKYMTLHDRKKIESPNGKVLFNLSDKMLSIRKTTVGEDHRGREVLKVVKKWSPGSKLTATAVDKDDKEHTLVLNGDMYGVSANIELKNGIPLAHISRKLVTVTDIVADKQTYYVTIAPGVDVSLIAAVCIVFDEVMNEEKEK